MLVDAVLAAIAEARGDEAFALTLAKASAARPLGMFGHMVWLSGTVRDAMTRAVKFYAMVTRRTRLALAEGAQLATIRQHPASERYRAALAATGHFTALCDHGNGHDIPLDAAPSVAAFFAANGFGAWPSPYAAGLPADFPVYCAVL